MTNFKEMKFKGKTVHVEVDSASAMVLDKGRAKMKYHIEDNIFYSPWPANLEEFPGAAVKTVTASPVTSAPKAPRKKKAKTASVSSTPLSKDTIIAYTDGGCIGNPGPAGLGYLIRFPDGKLLQKGEPLGQGTNNIAELTAILRVLELVDDKSARLVIHTDSSYSIGVLTQNWKAKANQQLIALIKQTMVPFDKLELRKVKAHSGVPDNELVDDLARTSAETQLEQS